MLKILTIDDHEVVRRGIKEMFTEESATFGEARSGAELSRWFANNIGTLPYSTFLWAVGVDWRCWRS